MNPYPQNQTEISEPDRLTPPLARRRRWPYFVIFLILAIFATLFVVHKMQASTINNDPTQYDPITFEPIKKSTSFLGRVADTVFPSAHTLIGQNSDRINILLLGQGGPGHDGPYLTDTIIIASIKPSTKQISLVSLPRDLGINIPGNGWRKINSVNAIGETKNPGQGAEFARQVIADTFDIDIPYYVRVDFPAFKEIINTVGGIRVMVDRSFTDTSYPAANDLFQTVSFSAGEQTMNGDTALKYARSRHGGNGEGSDFARARRQQKMLLALKEKLLSFNTLVNPLRLHQIINSLADHLSTNLEFADIITFIRLGKTLDSHNLTTLVLDNSPDNFLMDSHSEGGGYYLVPKTGNFKNLNSAIDKIFIEPPKSPSVSAPLTQEAPPNLAVNFEIQNGTWKAGLAARVKVKLETNGLAVSVLGNTANRPVAKSVIYQITPNGAESTTDLANILSIPILSAPNNLIHASQTDVLLVLGDDYVE